MLGPSVQFLSASRETDAPQFLDHDVDSLGLFERNKILCLPCKDGQRSYRVRSEDLQVEFHFARLPCFSAHSACN